MQKHPRVQEFQFQNGEQIWKTFLAAHKWIFIRNFEYIEVDELNGLKVSFHVGCFPIIF